MNTNNANAKATFRDRALLFNSVSVDMAKQRQRSREKGQHRSPTPDRDGATRAANHDEGMQIERTERVHGKHKSPSGKRKPFQGIPAGDSMEFDNPMVRKILGPAEKASQVEADLQSLSLNPSRSLSRSLSPKSTASSEEWV